MTVFNTNKGKGCFSSSDLSGNTILRKLIEGKSQKLYLSKKAIFIVAPWCLCWFENYIIHANQKRYRYTPVDRETSVMFTEGMSVFKS